MTEQANDAPGARGSDVPGARRIDARGARREDGTLTARVEVLLKRGVLDPQGEAVRHALGSLGFESVRGVRIGKVIEIELQAGDRSAAEAEVRQMCEKLLANVVVEDFRVEVG